MILQRIATVVGAVLSAAGLVLAAVALAAAVMASLLVPGSGREAAAAPGIVIGRVHASFQPEDGKIFVLVIGNDARSGNPNRALADAIHVIGVNTKTMRGGILNFPRDSWVQIPGRGASKINEALVKGGPPLVAKTVEQLTGIHLDYWAMVGFKGFEGIVRDVGGIPMTLPRAINDPGGSGANLRAGRQRLTYWQALAYVRTRKSLPDGDIDRSTNQARFLIAMLAELRRDVAGNPAQLMRWMAAARKHARSDLGPSEMFRLGILATQLSPKKIGNVTVPVSQGQVGAASVVFISGNARSIYRKFERTGAL